MVRRPFIEKSTLSSLICNAMFAIYLASVYAQVSSWFLYCVPLVYLSVPVPITVALIIWLGKFSVLFLFTIIFVVIDHLLLHINSGISFSSFMKNTVRILIETTMTHSIINLGKTDVFIKYFFTSDASHWEPNGHLDTSFPSYSTHNLTRSTVHSNRRVYLSSVHLFPLLLLSHFYLQLQ